MIREPRNGQTPSILLLLLLATTTTAVSTAAAILLWQRHQEAKNHRHTHTRKTEGGRSSSMPIEGNEDIFPPLPPQVVALLQSTRLCHLSTTSGDGIPHLSLMNFTYRQEEEVIIMTTRKDTKKYDLLQRSPKVAVLVHDFPSLRATSTIPSTTSTTDTGTDTDTHIQPPTPPPISTSTYAITLNGVAKVQAGTEAERLRALHLKNNPSYAQFIEGENIAVFSVHVLSARICNVEDKVEFWDKNSVGVK